ncbi:RNA-binding Raly-like protein isoform X1 [Elephas maximus indicus]|uniref:RNA-binding Raly-like protein isoform X1 n=1 Tax=Elephas maximus indicus TaxID=99487 RepID=UPI0021171491|nr:RNA-binding Raly-like protein isoform X1 [Elephas maximus indicus]
MSPGPKPFRGPPSPAPRRRSATRAPRLMAAPAAPPPAHHGGGTFRGRSGGLVGPGPCWPSVGPQPAAVTLLRSPEACRRHLDMPRELKTGQARAGQKRQPGTAIFCSNYDLDYKLYRKDVPYRVYEYQRIPPLINRVPVKIRKTHVGMGVKSSFSPHKVPRNSHLAPRQIKLRIEELHAIRGELSQIKAQVDSLLESLEHMDQQRDQPAGTKDHEENRGAGSEKFSRGTTEPPQEPKAQRAAPEADSSEESTDTEEPVENHILDQESSQ